MGRQRTRPSRPSHTSSLSSRGKLPFFLLTAMSIAASWCAWPVMGQRLRGPQPAPQNTTSVRLLLWLPAHFSEPDDHVHAAINCLFRRWTPSTCGEGFDVLITLAGDEKADAVGMTERATSLQSIITDGVQHLSPPPRVTALSIILSADTYDVDEARGRSSSFAGPNELFYRAMIQDEREPEGVISTTKLPSDSLPALIARYAFVQVVETDCCATADGWLDDLLKPMKDDPDLLISGSRGRGACWTGAEYGGCKPMVDPAIPHAHLRDHINGNAMYRVGRELAHLVTSARDLYGSTVPFDVALHLVSGGDRAADNGRSYSVMGLPVDESRFAEASYYGTTCGVISFVHAPRRLRAPSLQAVLRRLDSARPVTVVVVSPRGVDQVMLYRLHESLVRTKEARNAVYLVADEGGYALVANVAPMRVLMMGGGGQVAPGSANLLSSLSSMARAGLATFTMGLDATILQPYIPHLMALADEQPGNAWVVDGPLSPRAEGAMSTQTLPGLLFVPASEQAGKFLEAWAKEARKKTAPLSIKNLAARHHLSLAPLPPDLFPLASSYAGPLWTDEARRSVAAAVSWDGQQPSLATAAALSALGLWRSSSSSSTPFRCANYSVLGTRPLPLTNLPTIHRSLAVRAAFASFVREEAIACVVLPGFRLATTGNVVPDGVVVGKGVGALLTGGTVVFTSLADLKAVGRAVGGLGDLIQFEHVKRTVATSGWSSRWGRPARRSIACAAFGRPAGTSCFPPSLAALVNAAITALPPSYQCALDARRTHQEVTLLSLEGRQGEVGGLMRQRLGGRGRQPILLTGAWRHASGGQLTGNAHTALPEIITLADLTAPPSASLDPISRFVRFGSIKSTFSLADSPWADVIEYAVCQGAEGVRDLMADEPDSDLGFLSSPLTPSSVLARLAALIPPAVLAADLTALARWLDRPDRPSLALAAQWARLDLADSPPIMADDFRDAIVAPSLGLAQAVGAKAVTLPPLPVPWSALVGEPALRRAYTDHATLLPGSVGGLLGLPAGIGTNISQGLNHLYPTSIDVLHSPVHRGPVRALERALSVPHGKAHKLVASQVLQLPAAVSPAQHGRLKHFAAGARSVVFSFSF